MATADKLTTIVSTKGQVILPKAIREERRWPAGTRLTVEATAEGVLLRAAPVFRPIRIGDVFGSLLYNGPAKTPADMDAGIAVEVKRRNARDRH